MRILRDRSKIRNPTVCNESCECQFESSVGILSAMPSIELDLVHDAHPCEAASAKSKIGSLKPPSVVKSVVKVSSGKSEVKMPSAGVNTQVDGQNLQMDQCQNIEKFPRVAPKSIAHSGGGCGAAQAVEASVDLSEPGTSMGNDINNLIATARQATGKSKNTDITSISCILSETRTELANLIEGVGTSLMALFSILTVSQVSELEAKFKDEKDPYFNMFLGQAKSNLFIKKSYKDAVDNDQKLNRTKPSEKTTQAAPATQPSSTKRQSAGGEASRPPPLICDKRKRNIIIEGLYESNRRGDDQAINSILYRLGCRQHIAAITNVDRIGVFRGRNRFIIVEFYDEQAAREVLKKSPSLKWDSEYAHVFIKRDKSPEERQAEFEQRKIRRDGLGSQKEIAAAAAASGAIPADDSAAPATQSLTAPAEAPARVTDTSLTPQAPNATTPAGTNTSPKATPMTSEAVPEDIKISPIAPIKLTTEAEAPTPLPGVRQQNTTDDSVDLGPIIDTAKENENSTNDSNTMEEELTTKLASNAEIAVNRSEVTEGMGSGGTGESLSRGDGDTGLDTLAGINNNIGLKAKVAGSNITNINHESLTSGNCSIEPTILKG